MPQKEKYGLLFNEDWDDAQIERYAIRHGGLANGLLWHFKRYWQLLWPADSQNEWTDLILKNILEHQFISLVGPASSWKSGTVARLVVMDWSCYPDCTSVIMSSTDMEGLKSRVYAEVTMVWHRAHELYEWFPGNPVDSKCVITHTDIEEDKARDLRNSILGVPCKTSSGQFIGMGKYCFAAETPVLTEFGYRPIASIQPGDMVVSAAGLNRVSGCSNHVSDSMVEISMNNGEKITCTSDHPFLTTLGWVNAIDLLPESVLLSPDETMRILHKHNPKTRQEVLLAKMSNGDMAQALPLVQEVIHPVRAESDFLHSLLWGEMENVPAGHCEAHDRRERFGRCWTEYQQGDNEESTGTEKAKPESHKNDEKRHHKAQPERFWGRSQNESLRVRRCWDVSRSLIQFPHPNRTLKQAGPAGELLSGFRMARHKIRRGGRWSLSQVGNSIQEGCREDNIPGTPRVVGIKILKHQGQSGPDSGKEGHRVYNIEVEGHPSYVVSGCVVHNSGRKNRRVWCIGEEYQFMQTSILQAQDNLISNSDGENPMHGFYPKDYQDPQERGLPRRGYKCVFVGNTNPSVPDNPLDIVSEPELGWNSVPQATETVGITQVWKCKKHPKHPIQCWCINLDALDSPNSKHPINKPRWAHMAGPHKVSTYTVGSESYWSNGRGVFKFGLAEFKIITKEVCEQFQAFDQLLWDGSETLTNIGMCDAAYGSIGGDRCPVGWLQFGKCMDGVVRILFKEFWNCPVVIKKGMIPEDQISVFTKEKMESVGVLPENFFFDGRGSLAMSFARIWSPNVNAVEFGGSPTDRPAGPDIFVLDEKTGQRRIKSAKEHFSKFVTELWWSWRYAVESNQMRGLTLDIVLDAQPREWKKVKGDKIEAETKRDMRTRTGISPDLADMLVTGIEGARRRGFQISKLAAPVKSSKSSDWLAAEADAYAKMQTTKELKLA